MKVRQVVLLAQNLRVVSLSAGWRPRHENFGLLILVGLFELLTQFFNVLLQALFAFPIELELFDLYFNQGHT